MSNEQRLDQKQRLLEMREYLGVRALPEDRAFETEVVHACVRKVQPVIAAHADRTGEVIVAAIAKHLGVRFEEVKTAADIDILEQKYLVEQRELGFGRLAQELADPSVDALLFQRLHVEEDAPDRWIAVINLQETESRGYWSRPHEIVHRLAEPPQRRLPFFRHRLDRENRIERIVDLGAAELAFPQSAFGKLVQRVTTRELTWDLVQALRQQFAPTSSVLAAAKALLRYWPQPAFLLVAKVRGRQQRPGVDVALRIDIEGFSASAERSAVWFFPNMRVPETSPIWHTHESLRSVTEYENLATWATSGGNTLPACRALTAGLRLGSVVYGLVSLV
ncbi:MAG: hypothetical protein HYX43_09675 [Burkholderiales bacterium]|nr:hypothetical protein [Burkholderiales bacterium]